MTDTNPFETMRKVFAPRGTAEVTNLTANLANPYFDSNLVASAIDAAEARVISVARLGDLAQPISLLEQFALQVLMRASGQA